jgi:hypothetical protein
MRSVLVTVLALTLATPAYAATSEAQSDLQEMAAKFNDPGTQSALAGGLSSMLGALMGMRVDGLAKALEPINGGKKLKLKGNTLGEIAGRKDPHFQEKLSVGTRSMVGGLGAMMSAMATMMPQLEAAMGKMGDAIDQSQSVAPETR